MEAAGDADLSSWAVDQGEDQQQPPPLPAEDELAPRGEDDSLEAVEAQVIELRRIVKVAAELVRAEEQELEYLRAQSRRDAPSSRGGGETAEQRRRRLAAERKAELAAQAKHAGPRPALRTKELERLRDAVTDSLAGSAEAEAAEPGTPRVNKAAALRRQKAAEQRRRGGRISPNSGVERGAAVDEGLRHRVFDRRMFDERRRALSRPEGDSAPTAAAEPAAHTPRGNKAAELRRQVSASLRAAGGGAYAGGGYAGGATTSPARKRGRSRPKKRSTSGQWSDVPPRYLSTTAASRSRSASPPSRSNSPPAASPAKPRATPRPTASAGDMVTPRLNKAAELRRQKVSSNSAQAAQAAKAARERRERGPAAAPPRRAARNASADPLTREMRQLQRTGTAPTHWAVDVDPGPEAEEAAAELEAAALRIQALARGHSARKPPALPDTSEEEEQAEEEGQRVHPQPSDAAKRLAEATTPPQSPERNRAPAAEHGHRAATPPRRTHSDGDPFADLEAGLGLTSAEVAAKRRGAQEARSSALEPVPRIAVSLERDAGKQPPRRSSSRSGRARTPSGRLSPTRSRTASASPRQRRGVHAPPTNLTYEECCARLRRALGHQLRHTATDTTALLEAIPGRQGRYVPAAQIEHLLRKWARTWQSQTEDGKALEGVDSIVARVITHELERACRADQTRLADWHGPLAIPDAGHSSGNVDALQFLEVMHGVQEEQTAKRLLGMLGESPHYSPRGRA